MAFHEDFRFAVEGDVIAYSKSRSIGAAALPPKQGLSLHFPADDGKIIISATSLDRLKPSRTRVVGPHLDPNDPEEGPGSTIEEFNSTAAVIELFPPGQHTHVRSFKIPSGFSETEAFEFEHMVASPAPKGQWEVRIVNTDKKAAKVELNASFIVREPLRQEFLAHRLLDHAYLVVLEALQPSVRLSGSNLTISFSEELRGFSGGGSGDPLAPTVVELDNGTFSIEGEGHLASFEMLARSGRTLLEAVEERFQAVKAATELALSKLPASVDSASAVLRNNLQNRLKSNIKFRQEWKERVRADDGMIHAVAAFSDITVIAAADFGLFDVDARGVIRNAMVHIYIAFDHDLRHCDVLALSPPVDVELTDFEAKLAGALGIIPELNEKIEENLPGPIEKAGRQIGRFLGEALTRLSSRDSVFHSLTSNDTHWVVQYTDIPVVPVDAGGEGTVHGVDVRGSTHGPIGGVGAVGGGVLDPGTGGGSGPALDPSLGVLPTADKFVVVKPETLARLDEIDTLVFVMMENRSFDHMLGYLRASRGPEYEGLHGNESNLVAGRTQPVHMLRARDIMPNPVTQIPISPSHDFEPVRGQIADGAMSGFAQDFENRHPGFAELVMTFYTDEELKVYDDLAANYSVCDHWFCAHAGPTFPNRFVTLTGSTPKTNNHEVDDPELGFLPERTIFDVLRERSITWAVYESDLSIIRTFNRFRLNATEVRPYFNRQDPSQSFAEVAKRGELPQVVFVEPNFVDIPPISTANDDHPPADLRRGQNFIADIVHALKQNSNKWARTMLVITYDEHGGFYDHVAPPGTSLGGAEFIGNIPRVHPEGRDFMGPRVPSFVVSPWVSAGSVCKDVLDHTSIIKTILLRHRDRIPTAVFTQFGERVNMITHLGVVLDLDQPRNDPPGPSKRMQIERESLGPAAAALLAKLGPAERDDFHESLRRTPLPKRK